MKVTKKIVSKIAKTEQEVSTGCTNVVRPMKWHAQEFFGVDLEEAKASNSMVKPTRGRIKYGRIRANPKNQKAQVNPENGPCKGKESN